MSSDSGVDCDVVILAAGRGTRMGTVLPKCLTEIEGQSLLCHQIEALWQAKVLDDFERLHVVVGYNHHLIRQWTAHYPKINLIYNPFWSVSGVMGSAWVALPHLKTKNVLRLDGDVLLTPEARIGGVTHYEQSLLFYDASYRPREAPEVLIQGSSVQAITLRSEYAADREWLCVEWYTNDAYRKVVEGALELVPEGHYYHAINKAIAMGRAKFDAYKLPGAYEIDTKEDLEYVKGIVRANGS